MLMRGMIVLHCHYTRVRWCPCRAQLRHPNVLAFKDSVETTEKGATVIYLVTEPVKPLKLVLQELNLEGQHRCAGWLWGVAGLDIPQ